MSTSWCSSGRRCSRAMARPTPCRIRVHLHSLVWVLAKLQRTNICHYRPAVLNRDLRRVTVHLSPAVGHHVKKVPYRCVTQTVVVIGRRRRKAAADYHSVALSDGPVADDAVDVETFLPAVDQFLRYR